MRFAFLMSAMLLLATACSSGPTATNRASGIAPTGVASAAAGCTGAVGLPVAILNFTYNPNPITVPVGGSVTWTNADATAHTVTFDSGPDCGRIESRAVLTRTFDTAGSFPYHCALHPATMKATVVVQ